MESQPIHPTQQPSGRALRVRVRRSKKELRLGSFHDGTSLAGVVKRYLGAVGTRGRKIPLLNKAVSIEEISQEGPFISGLLRCGVYGFENNIIDTETNKIAHRRTVTEADLVPFFFEFFLPPNSTKGIMVIQTSGPSGIRHLMDHVIVAPFREEFKDHIFQISPLIPPDAVKALLKDSRVETIRLIKHEMPSDISQAIFGTKETIAGDVEIKVRPKLAKSLAVQKISAYFNGDIDIRDVFEVDEFDYDNIKIQTSIAGKRQTIDFLHPSTLKPSKNISGEITFGLDGYPKIDSVKVAARSFAMEYINRLGIDVHGTKRADALQPA